MAGPEAASEGVTSESLSVHEAFRCCVKLLKVVSSMERMSKYQIAQAATT